MIGNKQEVLTYLEKDKDYRYIIHKKETKAGRTLQQNKTFYKLFTDIGTHLGEDKEDVHDMMLGGVFGTKEVTIGILTKEVLIEKHTSKLTKEQGIKFIDTILAFTKKYDMPITVSSAELQSLYDTYNL